MEKNAQKENRMGTMPIPRLVLTMAIPLMLSLLVQSLYNIVDSIFVSRMGVKALAATSLAYPVQILMIALAVGTGVGVNAMLSHLLGARRFEEVRKGAATGLFLAIVTSLVFTLAGLTLAGRIAKAMTSDTETAELCGTYLTICMVFCGGCFLETMAQRCLQASGKTFFSMISLVIGALTNICLDPVMIFGLFGFPALGIAGAAIATVIGQWLGAVTALLLNHYLNPEVRPQLKGWRPDKAVIMRIYKVGLPTIVMQAMGSIMNFSMNGMLMGVSASAVAFFGVYYKLQNFLFMPMNGLGQASLPIIGYNYGAQNDTRIHQTLRTTLPIAIVIALTATALFLLFPGQLLSLFNADEEMLAIGIPAIRVICVTFVLSSVTTILGFSAAGLGNGFINMMGTGLRQVILLLPVAWMLLHWGGVGNIWYAMWISEAGAAAYAVWATRSLLRYTVEQLPH